MLGKLCLEHDAAGHTVSTVRKQAVRKAGAQLFLLIANLDLSLRMLPPILRAALPSRVKPHRHTQKCVSVLRLSPLKVTMEVNHQNK